MNIFNFLITISISLFVGIFIGYCLKKVVNNISKYYLQYFKRPSSFIEISPHLGTSFNKQNPDDKAKTTTD